MADLSGKVAVVTGAASGIGYALAEKWVSHGMKVVLADIEVDDGICTSEIEPLFATSSADQHRCGTG